MTVEGNCYHAQWRNWKGLRFQPMDANAFSAEDVLYCAAHLTCRNNFSNFPEAEVFRREQKVDIARNGDRIRCVKFKGMCDRDVMFSHDSLPGKNTIPLAQKCDLQENVALVGLDPDSGFEEELIISGKVIKYDKEIGLLTVRVKDPTEDGFSGMQLRNSNGEGLAVHRGRQDAFVWDTIRAYTIFDDKARKLVEQAR